ncbi:MAG: flagellar FliJ family protein [Planctomycetota bacterium]|nr:flagellar FliJ family protein [Planctomycetota bacterium]
MARFIFELEAVLAQRRAQERERQLAVAALERERTRLEGVIRGCKDSITSTRDDLRAMLRPGASMLDAARVRLAARAELGEAARAQRAVIELAGVHRRLEVSRRALLEAAVRRKAVELLRERRYEAWRSEQHRREDAALDEMGVMRAARAEEPA